MRITRMVTLIVLASPLVSGFILPPLATNSHIPYYYDSPSSQRSQSSSATNNRIIHDETCDVLILGSGPAARAIASLLSTSSSTSSSSTSSSSPSPNLNILLADANYDRAWTPNYGVWEDEWESICQAYSQFQISGEELRTTCIDTQWDITDCYFGGSFEIPITQRCRIDRPYLRVDKDALQQTLSPNVAGAKYQVIKANHNSNAVGVNLFSPPNTLVHDENGSTIQLTTKEGRDISVRAKIILDATGHETSLILKDSKSTIPSSGYQIAYGMLVEVEGEEEEGRTMIGPYDTKAMTLFDYRTDHIPKEDLETAEQAPTFMYAMPLGGNKIFFEETSLVARPAMSFQDCQTRCHQRLDHLNIHIKSIVEEEFCYIPMGGPLPLPHQRIIGFGGANTMVHPSTGYNLCRTMMGAVPLAKVIQEEFLKEEEFDPDKTAAQAYDAIWSPSNIRQRNFAVFGGEFLMSQNVKGLRGFFDGFFQLPIETWSGFLAGWPGLPHNELHETWTARLWFGLQFVAKLPLEVSAAMAAAIVTTSLKDGGALIQSVTPLWGSPEGYGWENRPKTKDVGDVAAKVEAKRMIQESQVTKDLPVAFGIPTPSENEMDNVVEEDNDDDDNTEEEEPSQEQDSGVFQ